MSHVLVLNQDGQPKNLFPISTIKWEDAIKNVYADTMTALHYYEKWEVHSPSVTLMVPSVVMEKRYIKRANSIRFTATNVYLRDRFTCQYCSGVFSAKDLTRDHVLPQKFGGKTAWDNIVASCSPCNQRKGHNRSIVPRVKPRRPSYYEMIERAKEYTITVPDESWIPYLNWPEDRIRIGRRFSAATPISGMQWKAAA